MLPTGFYAYPSDSGHLSETIETAIKSINQRQVIHIKSWRKIKAGGKIVINEILNETDSSDLFLCDLTGLNPNVLFELGFSIANRKRVWLTLDITRRQNSEQVQSLPIINSFGYQQHVNYDEISNRFLTECPYDDLLSHILQSYDKLISGRQQSHRINDLFYIPGSVESTAFKMLRKYLESLKKQKGRKVVVYDHLENSIGNLQWFLRNILEANSVIVHLDDPDSKDALTNNARCSLLAGMAIGFGRNVRMIAPAPFDPPFDYRELLAVYETGTDCKSIVEKWLSSIFMTRLDRESASRDPELALLEFHIGEPIAENEEVELSNYFVPTSAYIKGTRDKMGIFVGRKGTGKTANLYQLREHYSKERSNLVVTIKPVSFRIAVFGSLLHDFFPRPDDAADFVERTWRAIIYAELAVEVCRWIEANTKFREPEKNEAAVINHVDNFREFVEADFAGRIDKIRELIMKSVDRGDSPKAALHTIARDFSKPLVTAYSSLFRRRFQQVVILVDNLDKAWSLGDDVDVQRRLIYGLLEFQNTIGHDLLSAKSDIRLFIFLREDIFTKVMEKADEPDKVRLSVIRIAWPDGERLLDILEKRFLYCSPELTVESIWSELFCREVAEKPTRDYLLDHVMPRPRDLIHVVHSAIETCASRSHHKIESDDLRYAIREYFQFLLDNLFTEYGIYMPPLRELIQAFSGTKTRQNRYQIRRTLREYIRRSGGFLNVIEFLFRVSFIGIEHGTLVTYAYTNDEAMRLLPVLRRRLKWYNFERTYFVVHPAFRAGLELDEST